MSFQRVEERSAVLHKELGVANLAFTQILHIVGLAWVGVAARLGPSHVVFWMLAAVFFYVPSALVVIYLSRIMPLEGGLYQWSRHGLGSDLAGFLVEWNLWLFATVLSSEMGLIVATNLSYSLHLPWLAESKWFIALANCIVVGSMVVLATIGLGVGKWIHNAGGALMVALFAALLALPAINAARGDIAPYNPLPLELPVFSLLSLNILGKMGFGAFGGFEYVAIFAGECREARRAIGRSVILAAPAIAAMFILGTSSVFAFVQGDRIDLIGPIPQVLSLSTRSLGIGASIVSVVILLSLGIRLGQLSVTFSGTSRLPLVAGWDNLLPEWFTRLHPRYRTPVNSIRAGGAITLALALGSTAGVGSQESFQLLQNAAGIFYALTYLVLFAIPIVGLRGLSPRPSMLLRAACASGWLMTLLYVSLSVFPIIAVPDSGSFTAKIVTVILGANAVGAVVYLAAGRRKQPQNAV